MEILPRYTKIVSGKEKPKFTKLTSKELKQLEDKARTMLESCELCERKCHVNRINRELGYCKVPDKLLVSSCFTHYGEESFLVPSLTVFFWSCNLSCIYCQNYAISHRLETPQELTARELAMIITKISQSDACKNINLVGGEPTPYLPFIIAMLRELKRLKVELPVVWNSNFYMTKESMAMLNKIIDVYLADFKYGNDDCAFKLSKAKNYFSVVSRNLLHATKHAEVLVRHLVLPSHVMCCSKPVLEWLSANLHEAMHRGSVVLNIMKQYRPEFKAYMYKEISRPVGEQEFACVVSYAEKLGLNYIHQ